MAERSLPAVEPDKTAVFIERFGLLVEDEGLPRTAGRIFALVLAADSALSFSEVAERLQVSRGGVSTNVRLLEEIGFIERVSRAGDRQDYFQFPPDMWQRQIRRDVVKKRKSRLCVEDLLEEEPGLSTVVRSRLDFLVELLTRSEADSRAVLEMIARRDG